MPFQYQQKSRNAFLLQIVQYVFSVFSCFLLFSENTFLKTGHFLRIGFMITKNSEYLVMIIQNFLRILFQNQGRRPTLAQLAVNVASLTIVTLC
jgi:hypothetical protein